MKRNHKKCRHRGIPERETTKKGVKGSFSEHTAPDSDGRHFQFQSKQVGTRHAGRESWFWSENKITVLYDGIGKGKIEMPELNDIIPSAFGKNEEIGIKHKEIGYESILIGGMSTGVTR